MGIQNENDIIINVENLQKTFYSIRGFWKREKHPVEAVQGISFSVRKGELFGMVGPNGAGKTTTVKMLVHPAAAHQRHGNHLRAGCGQGHKPCPPAHRLHLWRQQGTLQPSQRIG